MLKILDAKKDNAVNVGVKAVVLFMSIIVVSKLRAFHKILFRKLEKDLKHLILLIL